MPTEENRIESPSQNNEETTNERAEKQRTQSNDRDHETHQLDPKRREAKIASTYKHQNEERRPRQRKINTVCNFYKKSLVDMAWQERNVNSFIQPHADNIRKTTKEAAKHDAKAIS